LLVAVLVKAINHGTILIVLPVPVPCVTVNDPVPETFKVAACVDMLTSPTPGI